jgi:PPOX class probable FMN-dependent enzyme
MDEHTIDDVDGLRRHYRPPSKLVLDKGIDHVDDAVRGFLARAPLVVLATTSESGTDASPRGGPPGFVTALDDQRLAFGDLSGNNRLDSYTNLVTHPEVGMLFLVPGLDETLRVNGRASITSDPEVLARCTIADRMPEVAVVVEVDECFIHCAKALRRAAVWDPSTWPDDDERPSAAAALNDHLGLGVDPKVIEADLEAGYAATMWLPAGEPSERSEPAPSD